MPSQEQTLDQTHTLKHEVRYPLEIVVDGETMSVRGLDVALLPPVPGAPVDFPIEPAPAGTCPEPTDTPEPPESPEPTVGP